jgi:SAM-dependent methyltransferase
MGSRKTITKSKNIMKNQIKISPSKKIKLGLRVVRENGSVWTILFIVHRISIRFFPKVAEWAFAASDGVRKKGALPGINSKLANKIIWDNWDWSEQGEEWTLSKDWKQSVINTILDPNIRSGAFVLEIGPGAGRWTIELQKRAARILGIDISEASIRECRRRFSSCANAEFRVGSGSDLEGVPDASVDAIWSFDVFVHINRSEFLTYAKEFARVLRPGGRGVIHHGSCGGFMGGWRSDICLDDVSEALRSSGAEIIDQFSSWRDQGRDFTAGLYGDVITIFRRSSPPAGK